MGKILTITQRIFIPATPQEIYEAYTDAEEQTQFTESVATSDPRVGGRFTSWDGYISGKYIELEPGYKIVQKWISSEFPDGSAPSKLVITLNEVDGGSDLFMTHSGVPEELAEDIERGWKEYYWEPMKRYFEKRKQLAD